MKTELLNELSSQLRTWIYFTDSEVCINQWNTASCLKLYLKWWDIKEFWYQWIVDANENLYKKAIERLASHTLKWS